MTCTAAAAGAGGRDRVLLVEAELVDGVVPGQPAPHIGEGLGDLALHVLGRHPGCVAAAREHVDGQLHELRRTRSHLGRELRRVEHGADEPLCPALQAGGDSGSPACRSAAGSVCR